MIDVPASAAQLENRVLRLLPQAEWDRLRLGMVPVQLVSGQVLIERDHAGDHVFFLERGFVCLLYHSGDRSAQVALIGNEGLVGSVSLLGGGGLSASAVIRAPGLALRMPLPLLKLRLDQCPSLRDAWLRHLHGVMADVMQTAIDNACSTLDQRCARWLLMADARIDGDQIPVTHETLASMLGVFRSGVTTALSNLHGRGLIQPSRGRIAILDRDRLRRFASGSLRSVEVA